MESQISKSDEIPTIFSENVSLNQKLDAKESTQ